MSKRTCECQFSPTSLEGRVDKADYDAKMTLRVGPLATELRCRPADDNDAPFDDSMPGAVIGFGACCPSVWIYELRSERRRSKVTDSGPTDREIKPVPSSISDSPSSANPRPAQRRKVPFEFFPDSCDKAQDPVKGHPRPMIESVGEKLPMAHKPPNPTNFYCTKCKITLEPCGKMDSMICG